MGERITDDIISQCHQCGEPCDTHVNCANEACHLLFIQCDSCAEKMESCCSTTCVETIYLPLEEQEKIALIRSTVDEQIDNVDALIEKNKELKKGLMQTLLTKGIGHTKFKKTEIGEIPEEWEVKILDEISANYKNSIVDGPFGSNLKTEAAIIYGRNMKKEEPLKRCC